MSPAEIEKTLETHLTTHLPHHTISEVYTYATLPGGKLFRPHLVWSVLSDLNPELYQKSALNKKSAHAYLASAVELHHSYTLIHDDLPCMDDDTERRGKPCTHLAFGEWKALLAGDGLLNLSYQLLGKTNNARSMELIRFFSWALGPKGLIHGQVLDLSLEMTLNFENTLRTHELKTARLIQVAILGSAMLAGSKNFNREKKLWKYSRLLGINFQLIDDLSELAEKDLSAHELSVNPWLKTPEMAHNELYKNLVAFAHFSDELALKNTNNIVREYYSKMLGIIEKDKAQIDLHLKHCLDLAPIMLLLKAFR